MALSAAVGVVVAAPVAQAQTSAGTLAVSPTTGRVGTVVRLSGQVAPSCVPGGTVTITFAAYGQTAVGGFDTISALVAPDWRFAVAYQDPPDLGGAATRGLYAYRTSPGVYQFEHVSTAGCAPSPAVAFSVTGSSAPAATAFVGMAPTPGGKGYSSLRPEVASRTTVTLRSRGPSRG